METLSSDFLLATTLRAIGDGVISCNRHGNVVLINPVAQSLTGWSEEEARGHNLKEVFRIVDESTRTPVEDPVEKVLRLGRIVGLANHTVLLRRDGTEIAIDDSAAPITDEHGTLRGVVLVFRDVTERRQAEWNVEMLAASGQALGEARALPSILRRIGVVVSRHFADFCVFDLLSPDGPPDRTIGQHRLPSMQHVADQLLHFRPRPAPSLHPIPLVLETRKPQLLQSTDITVLEHMATSPEHLAYVRDQLKPRSILSVPLLAGNRLLGALTFYRHALAMPFDHIDVAAAEELGKRVGLAMHYAQVEAELRLQQERIDAILAAVPVGILVAEKSGKVVLANDEVSRIFRHEARYSADVAAHAEYVAFHPDGHQVRGEDFPLPRAMTEDRIIRDERFLYQRGDNTTAWISLSAAPVKDAAGNIYGGVVTISDVDDLVRAQHSAERSQKRLQTMMDRASVGIAIGDVHGGLSYANTTLLKWIGYSSDELHQGDVRWDQLTPPEFAAADARAIAQLEQDRFAEPYEKVYLSKNGTRVPMLVGAACIPSLQGDTERDDIAVYYTDLTLQKRAEQILLQTEKLTAVGRLASSISHEINNPLEAVTNLLFIVRNSPTLAQPDRDYLEAADRELARVSQITAQTLRFHRQPTAPTCVQPQKLIEEVLALYGTRLSGSRVEIIREFQPDLTLTCFEGDIRQVLSNLVANAFDAMRGGGTLRLRTRLSTSPKSGQPGVLLTLADTGVGMSDAVRQRIFEAFYSTKGIHGTGLGLWISKRIVHKHRGYFRVHSSTGDRHGTVFQLWLPIDLASSAREAWHADASDLQ